MDSSTSRSTDARDEPSRTPSIAPDVEAALNIRGPYPAVDSAGPAFAAFCKGAADQTKAHDSDTRRRHAPPRRRKSARIAHARGQAVKGLGVSDCCPSGGCGVVVHFNNQSVRAAPAPWAGRVSQPPVAWLGSTMTGGCVMLLSSGTADRSKGIARRRLKGAYAALTG